MRGKRVILLAMWKPRSETGRVMTSMPSLPLMVGRAMISGLKSPLMVLKAMTTMTGVNISKYSLYISYGSGSVSGEQPQAYLAR
jgi:hypothetical protein